MGAMSLVKVTGVSVAVRGEAGRVRNESRMARFNRMRGLRYNGGIVVQEARVFGTASKKCARRVTMRKIVVMLVIGLCLSAQARDEAKAAKNQGSNEVPR